MLGLLLVFNFLVSIWNAYAAGKTWRDSIGLLRLVNWAALVMSACGFVSVLSFALGWFAVQSQWITPRSANVMQEITYLLVIVPIIGSGLILTIESWVIAWKTRSVWDTAVAGWNTYAQVSNTVDAFRESGGMFESVLDFFKSDEDEENGSGAIVIILVAIALFLACGLTYIFWRSGCRNAVSANRPAPATIR